MMNDGRSVEMLVLVGSEFTQMFWVQFASTAFDASRLEPQKTPRLEFEYGIYLFRKNRRVKYESNLCKAQVNVMSVHLQSLVRLTITEK